MEKLIRMEIRVNVTTDENGYKEEFDNIRDAKAYIDEIMENVDESN